MARMRNGDMPELATTAKSKGVAFTAHVSIVPSPWPAAQVFPPPPPMPPPTVKAAPTSVIRGLAPEAKAVPPWRAAVVVNSSSDGEVDSSGDDTAPPSPKAAPGTPQLALEGAAAVVGHSEI